eukprot:jgi/Chrpa1/18747/Chrysochromulina_OHIO_Genome00002519-RA
MVISMRQHNAASPIPTGKSPVQRQLSGGLRRANALFYDDNAENLKGANPRGKHPSVLVKHCKEPLSVDDISRVQQVFAQKAIASAEDGSTPVPFFFFDFDGTLTMRDGLLNLAIEQDDLSVLFGTFERQRALQRLLSALLQAGQVYILTSNMAYTRAAQCLNALLATGPAAGSRSSISRAGSRDLCTGISAGASSGMARSSSGSSTDGEAARASHGAEGRTEGPEQPQGLRFAVDDTVRFVPVGNKLKILEEIIRARGFALCMK